MDQHIIVDRSNIFWHKEVPLKANIFAWRLLRNRLPTTYNLINRRVLQPNTTLYAGNCGKEEDINHLFLFCDFIGKVWSDIFVWLGLATVHSA